MAGLEFGVFHQFNVERNGGFNAFDNKLLQSPVRLAAAGYDLTWHHKRQWMSPSYTTVWKKILTVV